MPATYSSAIRSQSAWRWPSRLLIALCCSKANEPMRRVPQAVPGGVPSAPRPGMMACHLLTLVIWPTLFLTRTQRISDSDLIAHLPVLGKDRSVGKPGLSGDDPLVG